MKKFVLAALAAMTLATGCGGGFNTAGAVEVVSREDGSGTRGAFIELFKIEEKNSDGTKADRTTKDATVVNKTDVMLTTVATNPYAIGYVSMGSLNETVKALQVGGAAPSLENVRSGAYKIVRPFNIATKGEPQGLTKDFIDFILAGEGQDVVAANGYIPLGGQGAPAYAGSMPAGRLVVAGSSSVTPVMEKLAEAYATLNPSATIEIQMSDSTAGMTATLEGTCNIGMASRALTDKEQAQLAGTTIAMDGIAVIVSPQNPLEDITAARVKEIFTGGVSTWSAVLE
jgi:phosphate transport system substrate-binding protein